MIVAVIGSELEVTPAVKSMEPLVKVKSEPSIA